MSVCTHCLSALSIHRGGEMSGVDIYSMRQHMKIGQQASCLMYRMMMMMMMMMYVEVYTGKCLTRPYLRARSKLVFVWSARWNVEHYFLFFSAITLQKRHLPTSYMTYTWISQFLFCSGIQRRACFALLKSSILCSMLANRHSRLLLAVASNNRSREGNDRLKSSKLPRSIILNVPQLSKY